MRALPSSVPITLPLTRLGRLGARSNTPLEVAVAELMKENETLRRELAELETYRTLAYRDELTGLWNRRYFDERLAEEVSRARRDQVRLSVMVADVNDLKVVNDTLGHAAGDRLIRWVATFLKETLRAHDVCCRIGGDEFAVILPGVDAAVCGALIVRLRASLAEASERRDQPVTVSLGAATYPGDATGPRGLLAQADEAMYRDKRSQKSASALRTAS
jgi:diguanylate cyclase (GGDEF)-like protein